jgi:uncharacterized protein (DUF2141 family)
MLKLSILGLLLFSFMAQAEVVALKISHLNASQGQIGVAVFNDPDAFPDGDKKTVFRRFFPIPVNSNEMELTLDLRPGSYAMAVFLDENKNQKLDTNMIGVPTEKFGFSQNPKILFGAPNFSESEFEVIPQSKKQLTIKLLKLL